MEIPKWAVLGLVALAVGGVAVAATLALSGDEDDGATISVEGADEADEAVENALGDIPTTELSVGDVARVDQAGNLLGAYCAEVKTEAQFEGTPGAGEIPGGATEKEAGDAVDQFLELYQGAPDDPVFKPHVQNMVATARDCAILEPILDFHDSAH
jgi:hypothetical protein